MPGAGTQPHFTGKMSFTTQMSKANYATWWAINLIPPIIEIKLEMQICHINDLLSYARRHPIASKRFANAISCQWQLCIASQLTIADAEGEAQACPFSISFFSRNIANSRAWVLEAKRLDSTSLSIHSTNSASIDAVTLTLLSDIYGLYTLLSYLNPHYA